MKHWVFDLDGTLIDSNGHYEDSVKRIFAHFGRSCDPDELEKAHHFFSPFDYFRLYFDESRVKDAVAMLLRLNQEQIEQITLYDGIQDLVESLVRKDVAISVWTGRELASAARILEHTGIARHLRLCVSGTCVTLTKPHPEGLLKILSESKHNGDDVVMVGDHAYDMQGARSAGVKAVSVSWGRPGPSPLEKLSDRHFAEVAEFKTWALGHYA